MHNQLEVTLLIPIHRASHNHLIPHPMVLVPITVSMLFPILQYFIFGSFIPFLPRILPYWEFIC